MILVAKEVFSRYEVKYLLNTQQKENIICALNEHMDMDRYNIGGNYYTISNIYYDTEDNNLIQRSLAKPKYKEKLRMRGYGIPKPGDMVFVEIKKKYKGVVNKRRSSMELEEAKRYLDTGVMPEIKDYMNRQVMMEIDYFTHIYKLVPKLYLAYDRLAFFDRENSQFRVSFDTNIRSRRYDLALDMGDHGEKMLNDDTWLMEVKINMNLPLWFTWLLDKHKLFQCSFSKYGTEYARMVASSRGYPCESAEGLYSFLL